MPKDEAAAPAVNPINALQVAVLTAFLTPLQNINNAFAAIEADPTQAVVAEQIAVIQGQQVTLALELPALIPTLEGQAIALGAQQAQNGLGSLISAIQAQIAPPVVNPPATGG